MIMEIRFSEELNGGTEQWSEAEYEYNTSSLEGGVVLRLLMHSTFVISIAEL